MECNSSIKANEIPPFTKKQMGTENIMIGEISQTKTDIAYHLYMESKK